MLFQFWSEGILVLEDFLTAEEVTSLRESCLELVGEMDPNENHGVFSTTDHNQVTTECVTELYYNELR